jgi:Ca2+-binding protein (EF-Hand superfamily)
VGGHSPSHSRRFLLDDSNGTVPSTTKVGSSTVKKDDRMTSQSREDKVDAMKKSKAVKQSENAKGGKSLFSRSKRFQKMVDNVFVSIDTDGSGEIDKKELYAGLILIHLRLAAYVGPAACRPATKEYVEEIFDLLDADGSGQLSREEFGTVMAVLLSQITSRIVLYMIFPLVIIPLLARFLMDGISWGLEEWNGRMYGVSIPIPPGIQEVTSAAVEKMHDMVPADLWEKIPMTLISTMLGMLVLPWAIFQLDAFFNKLAANSKKKKKLPAGAEESSGRQAKKTT